MTDNTVTIAGNLTRDPEIRFTPAGQPTATFAVAVNRTWVNRQSGERQESTSFIDVVAWGTLAENAAASLAKGNRVLVTGRLDQRSWETEAGERRSKVEVSAEDLAPSLRWATAKLARTERRGAEEAPGPPAPSNYGPDEEPY